MAATIVQGQWELYWGGNILADIETIAVTYTVKTTDYDTVQYNTFQIDGSVKSTVALTLLATDTASLAAVLPQYFVPNGGTMSTGETVSSPSGAIDTVVNCTTGYIYSDLDIISCGNPGQVFRLKNARTMISKIDFDGQIRTVEVTFVGTPASGTANVQFFQHGAIGDIS